MIRRALTLRTTKVTLALAAIVALAMAPSPLLGLPGVESALVLGLILPPFVAASAARLAIAVRRGRIEALPSRVLGAAVLVAALTWTIPVALLGLNSLRIPSCDLPTGFMFVALGPGIGVCLAAVIGVLAGATVQRPWLATALAVAPFFAEVVLGVHRFWASPAIFSYVHLVGFFPGTIYDENVSIPEAYVSFRAVTLALAVGLAGLVAATLDPGTGAARMARIRAVPWRLVAASVPLFVAIVGMGLGEELGHRSSSEHIAQELGATQHGRRCIVHAPRDLDREELVRLAQDCDFRVAQMEEALGVEQREPVIAFLFRDEVEKQRLMGAGNTYIAKPWRDEVYLQLEGWPHPVLAHEVAHVIASNAASGPFEVGGQLGGWLPDPSLIEGLAVALAWAPRDELTPHQWVRAMIELDMAPPLEHVVGVGFLLQPARQAYTVSGSFLRYVLDTYGGEAVREAYRTGDIEAAVGKPVAELEREWLDYIATVSLPDDALALAQARFAKRSIFSAVCPHEVANLKQELSGDLAAADDGRAHRTCTRILEIDQTDAAARATLVGVLARLGDVTGAMHHLRLLEGPIEAPVPFRVAARQLLADAAWRRGDRSAALDLYRAMLSEPQWDDTARALEVKVLGLEAGGRQTEIVFDLLVGRGGRGATPPSAVHLARELALLRDDGLGEYLEARQLFNAAQYEMALPLLREALRMGMPTPRLDHEAMRLYGASLYAAGRSDEARHHWSEIASRTDMPAGVRAEADDWLARIRIAALQGAQARR